MTEKTKSILEHRSATLLANWEHNPYLTKSMQDKAREAHLSNLQAYEICDFYNELSDEEKQDAVKELKEANRLWREARAFIDPWSDF